ncbi:MAG: hypothetical protein LUD71_02350 [Clostridiales bacterium]|nr:hypothetical protein [Clostridiales bacterium]
MEENKAADGTLLAEAEKIAEIYDEFTQSVRSIGKKADGSKHASGKMARSVVNWIGGSHVKTERDILCDKFLEDVQKQLEFLVTCLEGVPAEEAAGVCGVAADVITEPRPVKSDSTTDLMKRAMIGQVIPLLPYLRQDQLVSIRDRMDKAYTRWQLFPVEKDVKKAIERLIA